MNTSQRELLLRGLDAIARERENLPFATEVLVLDNGSRDGSAEAARAHPAVDEVIALHERRGKALNDSELLRRARGRYALLLNEDSELLAGATLALYEALQERPDSACAGAALRRPDGSAQPSAWRFPTLATALAGALFLHNLLTVQSKGDQTRTSTGASRRRCSSRRAAAEQVGYLDPDFFVYSDEVDFARRLRDAAGTASMCRPHVAIHHEQLSTDAVPRAADRRTVAQPRPVHAQAPLPGGGAGGALADRLDLRAARARGARASRALAAALLASRNRDAASRPRGGSARGRRGVQPARTPRSEVPPARDGRLQRIGASRDGHDETGAPSALWQTSALIGLPLRELQPERLHGALGRAACRRRARAPRAPLPGCAPAGTGGR